MSKKDTKRMILESAIVCFFQKGSVRASMREIAQRAGITGAAIYIYFKNKDDLLYTILHDLALKFLEVNTKAYYSSDDPLESLKEMVRGQVSIILHNQREVKLYIEDRFNLPPHLQEKIHGFQRKIYDMYHDKICRLEEANLLTPVNKTIVTFSIFALTNWTYRWYHVDGEIKIEELANSIQQILYEGVLKK